MMEYFAGDPAPRSIPETWKTQQRKTEEQFKESKYLTPPQLLGAQDRKPQDDSETTRPNPQKRHASHAEVHLS
jgi:hypothetical protein